MHREMSAEGTVSAAPSNLLARRVSIAVLAGVALGLADAGRALSQPFSGSHAQLVAYILLAAPVFFAVVAALLSLWLAYGVEGVSAASPWTKACLAGLPLIAFVWWVPSAWLVESWGSLSASGVVVAAVTYVIFAVGSVVFARLCLLVVAQPSGAPVRRAFGVICLAIAALAFVADAKVLVDLYPQFHAGLAGCAGLLSTLSVAFLMPSGALARLSTGRRVYFLVGGLGLCLVGLVLTFPLEPARSGSLVFSKIARPFRAGAGALTGEGGVGLGALASLEYPIPEAEDFNVLLITIDALRADHIGAYGYARKTTPNIDALARKSLVFERAFSQAPKTFDSLPSLYTGLYPSNVPRNYDDPRTRGKKYYIYAVGTEATLLAERVAKKGHATAAFVRFNLLQWQHLDRGFQTFGILNDDLTDRAETYINTSRGPFYMALHYGYPHEPYVSHTGFDFGSGAIDRYDSEIAFTDQQIGKLIMRLEKKGLMDKTVIVISADHGEEFREHGGEFHSRKLYNELLHVPLVVHVPWMEPRRIDEPVELVDVAPFISDLLKLGTSPGEFDGQSLLATVAGKRANIREGAYSEGFAKKAGIVMAALRTKEWRGIFDAQNATFELYDVKKDPTEQHDVAAEHPEVVRTLKSKIGRRPSRDGASTGR